MNRCLQVAIALCLASCGGLKGQSLGAAPYVLDGHTLHLWHLDEVAPPFANEASPDFPLRGLLNDAAPGEGTLPGFGRSVSFRHHVGGSLGRGDLRGAILLAAPGLDTGPGDNAPDGFAFAGADGAFTFEAFVNLDVPPSDAKGIALGIVSMEGDGGDRVFNFRIEKEGFLSFIPLTGIGAAGGVLASIPISGPDAIEVGKWFHVAVTYDGREGESGNLRLYWTRVRPDLLAANRIGVGTLAADLGNRAGDFAIGNEARAFPGNAEAEPFPGRIDEVRISRVARVESDFAIVPPALRRPSHPVSGSRRPGDGAGPASMRVTRILVDEEPVAIPAADGRVEIPPGLHRFDIDFEVLPVSLNSGSGIRRQLAGVDERWQVSGQGMMLQVEALNARGAILARAEFPAVGGSAGWESTLDDSRFTGRSEAVFVPGGTKSVRLTLSSGAPDTTGLLAIDDLDVFLPAGDGTLESVWFNRSFAEGENIGMSSGKPTAWERTGSSPGIARLTIETANPALALVDTDPTQEGAWVAVAELPEVLRKDTSLVLKWSETYNVVGGSLHRATYVNVPPGSYVFRAIAPSGDGRSVASLSLPFVIRPPVWESGWFRPLVAALSVALVALLVFLRGRRRSRERLRDLQMKHAVAEDRARIARDMHDDLGTRITLITMNSALIDRDLGKEPERVRRHLKRLNTSARNLVTAMDDLVWAVDPSNDTLDRLGIFIARTVEEMFRDSPIRCRFRIPAVLPRIPLGSDFRHHVSLAVRECLHNILRHAGPCAAKLELECRDGELVIEISDDGRGFDMSSPDSGNGLGNMAKRLEELGGSCIISSSTGKGTTVRMRCPCPQPAPSKS